MALNMIAPSGNPRFLLPLLHRLEDEVPVRHCSRPGAVRDWPAGRSHGVISPPGRPTWKVCSYMLGTMLGLPGFERPQMGL